MMGFHCACDVCNAWRPETVDVTQRPDKDEARYAAREADRLNVPEAERMAFVAGWVTRALVK